MGTSGSTTRTSCSSSAIAGRRARRTATTSCADHWRRTMAKKKAAKRVAKVIKMRNPQDSTLRNVRAARARAEGIRKEVALALSLLETRIKALEDRSATLDARITKVEQPVCAPSAPSAAGMATSSG